MTAIWRLFSIVSLLLMPFGMAAAPAAPAGGHHADAAMPAEHCPEGDEQNGLGGAAAKCAMPCSAALPAVEVDPADGDRLAGTPAQPALDLALSGIELEIATPPPKQA